MENKRDIKDILENQISEKDKKIKKEKQDKARKKYEEKDPQKVRERVNNTKNRTLRVKYLCEKYGSEVGVSTKKYTILDPKTGNVVNEFIKMELIRCKTK